MCDARDKGCVVDVDEARRKFGGAQGCSYGRSLPKIAKRLPLFSLAKPPEFLATQLHHLVNVSDRSKQSILCVLSQYFALPTMSTSF